jgi:hypothetical protein
MSGTWKDYFHSPASGIGAPQAGLPGLLAYLCRSPEFCRPRLSHIGGLFIAAHHRIPDVCAGEPRIQSEKLPWIASILIGFVAAIGRLDPHWYKARHFLNSSSPFSLLSLSQTSPGP